MVVLRFAEFIDEVCFIPCPQDCLLSQWSAWSPCEVSQCGLGTQSRYRYLKESSLDGGRECSSTLIDGEVWVKKLQCYQTANAFWTVKLNYVLRVHLKEYETQPCLVSCSQYKWLTEDFSTCRLVPSLDSSSLCGQGLQSREVRYVGLRNTS